MVQLRIHAPTTRESPDSEQDALASVKARADRNREEASRRRQEREGLDRARTVAEADLEDLQSCIDERVSGDPEEFVIRFIQTEGQ